MPWDVGLSQEARGIPEGQEGNALWQVQAKYKLQRGGDFRQHPFWQNGVRYGRDVGLLDAAGRPTFRPAEWGALRRAGRLVTLARPRDPSLGETSYRGPGNRAPDSPLLGPPPSGARRRVVKRDQFGAYDYWETA